MRYRLQRHDGTDCSATMVPITVLRMVPIQRYRQEINDLPKIVEENRLYFVVDKIDKNNKAIAFFRHLRNAFAHFRIVREGEWLNIMDGVWRGKEKDKYWEKTMIGLIKYEDLKELCFIFFKQGDKLIARNIF